MQKFIITLIFGVFSLTACDTQPTNTYRPAPAIGAQENTSGDVSFQMPEQQQPQNAPVVAPGNASSTALNPEHGKPGHRCDIPVGSPLNGTPAATNQISTQVNTGLNETPAANQAKTNLEVPAATVPASSNKKLNPEHGQPGHDCAVPVGSPLP